MKNAAKGYALVTGAGGGLGGAFALEAARRGWALLLVDLPESGVKEVGLRLTRAYRVDARCFEMDLVDASKRESLAASIRAEGWGLDLLVNCAGTGCCSSFETAPLSRLAGIVDVNVQALMQLTHLCLPELERRPRAAIINVASLAAFYPMPSMAVYAASKAFILNFSLALRGELEGTGVTVSALCPAGMVTNRETADQVAAQGFFGRLTTWDPQRVAATAIRQAMKGRDIIIPGLVNRALRAAGRLAPRWLVTRVIARRWRKALPEAEVIRAPLALQPEPLPIRQ